MANKTRFMLAPRALLFHYDSYCTCSSIVGTIQIDPRFLDFHCRTRRHRTDNHLTLVRGTYVLNVNASLL